VILGAGRRQFALSIALGAGAGCAAVGLLATSAWLISRAAQHPGASALGIAIAGVQFFALSRALLRYAERLAGHDAALRALASVRAAVYRRLEPLAPAGLPAFGEGDLLARFVEDVDALQDLLLRVIAPFAVAALAGTATCALMWWLLPAAALPLALALLLSATAVPWLCARLARRGAETQADARGRLTAAVVDLAEGAPELYVNGALGARLAEIEALDARLEAKAAATARGAGAGRGLVTLLGGLALCATLAAAVQATEAGQLAPVVLATVALLPLAAFELVAGLPVAAQDGVRARRSAARVGDILDAEPRVHAPSRPAAVPAARVLRVRGLRARHGAGRPWVLDGVDLDLAPGRRVAVVGPSGAGKSTLAAVLLGFLDYEGSVTLGGAELRTLDADAYRRVVGLVAQDAHVFDTSLRENLLLADRTATDDALQRALRHARLERWTGSLPAGLETEAGPGGSRLSGGQRQRLALARAALAGFDLVVLDEPGEHLDVETGDAIVADALAGDRGVLLITHRLAGLGEMDEIIVLDRGRVAERGTHADLLGRGGRYAESWGREVGAATRARNT
jgi:thiol reductant ABC exporter CydC subunit